MWSSCRLGPALSTTPASSRRSWTTAPCTRSCTSAAADAAYFDESTDAYYCWGDEPFDHAVTVVGWDDRFSRDRFLEGHEPPGDGAFLVRNSWGTSFGDGGYFWVSYYDTCIGSRLGPAGTSKANSDVNAVVAGVEPSGGYADVYQHDPLGWTDSLGFGSDDGMVRGLVRRPLLGPPRRDELLHRGARIELPASTPASAARRI